MRKLASVCAAGLIVLTACSGNPDGTPDPTDDAGRARSGRTNPPPTVHAASLERFDACPELLSHVKTEAKKRVGPYGLPGAGGGMAMDALATGVPASRSAGVAESADAAAAPAPQAGTDFSATNVQERDVDEPDSIKTNGRHIFTLRTDERTPSNQRLVAIEPNDGDPRKVGDIVLPEGQNFELLLAGDHILALGHPGYQIYAGRAVADMAIYPP
ncbi:MAG: beta-propeller domain-containing protein, partial [Actinomycetota bacterium]